MKKKQNARPIRDLETLGPTGVKFATEHSNEKTVSPRIAAIMALRKCNPEVFPMRPSDSTDATEQRRKLLKGALGASTVVTLGYGSSAAAASITCIAKTTTSPDVQFYVGSAPPEDSNQEWKQVQVVEYSVKKNLKGPFRYFCPLVVNNVSTYYEVTNGVLATTATSGTVISGLFPTNNVTVAWVIAYFDPITGEEVGTYPVYAAPSQEGAPASLACLNSVNAANQRSTSGFSG